MIREEHENFTVRWDGTETLIGIHRRFTELSDLDSLIRTLTSAREHMARYQAEQDSPSVIDEHELTPDGIAEVRQAEIDAQEPCPSEARPTTSARCPGLRERAPLTHVAIVDTSGLVWSLPRPHRHHHVLKVMHDHGAKQNEGSRQDDCQGFLDAHGHYLTRKQALVNARLHHQLVGGKTIASILTSEDLW